MKKREANRVVLVFFEEKRRRSKYLNIASWMGLTFDYDPALRENRKWRIKQGTYGELCIFYH